MKHFEMPLDIEDVEIESVENKRPRSKLRGMYPKRKSPDFQERLYQENLCRAGMARHFRVH